MTELGNLPQVVSREEWTAARNELLLKEKDLTRARDRVNADRRRPRMLRIDKPYAFEGLDGAVNLLDLFEDRPQLVLHHFMYSPEWDQACSSCSSAADGIGRLRQLHVRNTTPSRQEGWEEPKCRAVALGLQVGGPSMRLSDEYDT
ncbi:MAG TPA: DUF899 family protein [Propionibacteriaceae bacterium]|nr:DUF899 family protein [Propionibacteriaceae bacterium]